jgi:hypothetical protein
MRAHGEGSREEFEDNVRTGRGGDIVVDGVASQKEIANASPCEVVVVSSLVEYLGDAKRCFELGRR